MFKYCLHETWMGSNRTPLHSHEVFSPIYVAFKPRREEYEYTKFAINGLAWFGHLFLFDYRMDMVFTFL